MKEIYSLGIRLYAAIIGLVAPFNAKAKDAIQGRKNLWTSLPDVKEKKVYWFHCASLGEFDQGLPLMNLVRQRDASAFILVTFFSPSGYNHYHKRPNPVDFACYMPFDTRKNAQRFVDHFQPEMSFFVKYEFWNNHITAIKSAGGKLFSISTALRPTQRFFRWYGGSFRSTLRQFDYFFAQNQSTVDLLKSIDISNAMLTGDTRFDRVLENKANLQVNTEIKRFVGSSKKVLIIGSCWPKDEEIIAKIVQSQRFEKYIIAPHNVDAVHVKNLLDTIQVPATLFTQLAACATPENILVIDAIGQLASAYSLGKIAYVGGGFSGSLHNILEPAVFGLPVIFGPKHSRFPEAQSFIDAGIGFSIATTEELSEKLTYIEKQYEQISQKSIHFVESNQGASEKIAHFVFNDYSE